MDRKKIWTGRQPYGQRNRQREGETKKPTEGQMDKRMDHFYVTLCNFIPCLNKPAAQAAGSDPPPTSSTTLSSTMLNPEQRGPRGKSSKK